MKKVLAILLALTLMLGTGMTMASAETAGPVVSVFFGGGVESLKIGFCKVTATAGDETLGHDFKQGAGRDFDEAGKVLP